MASRKKQKKTETIEDIKQCCHIDDNGCWNWLYSKYKNGYGSVKFEDKIQSVHRVAYKLTRPNEDINKVDILHSCDNPPCCNPEHLSSGTHKENMIDMAKKERHNKKLTIDQVRELEEYYCTHKISMRSLAKRYGISHQMVSMILSNKRRTVRKEVA